MNFDTRSREKKLVEALYPYFGELAAKTGDDANALRLCRHLLALKDTAISSTHILGFLDVWNSTHPEENYLTNKELLWAVGMLEKNIASQMRRNEKVLILDQAPKARLRIIQGGLYQTSLSENIRSISCTSMISNQFIFELKASNL